MAETNRAAATGQVAWTGESGLVVRLQLRRPQPAPAAKIDGSTTTSKAQGAVCLKTAQELLDGFRSTRKDP